MKGQRPPNRPEDTGGYEESINIFLRDEARLLRKLDAICMRLSTAPLGALSDRTLVTELFRVFHTIKGNASILGLESLAQYAHAVESTLQLIQDWNGGADSVRGLRSARFLSATSDVLKRIFEGYRSHPDRHPDFAKEIAQARTFASDLKSGAASEFSVPPASDRSDVKSLGDLLPQDKSRFLLTLFVGGKKLMLPCESVIEVLRDPQVLVAPKGDSSNALGLIRCAHGLVPLLDSTAAVDGSSFLTGAAEEIRVPWVVIVRGRGESQEDLITFSLPAHDIGAVVEVPTGTTIKSG